MEAEFTFPLFGPDGWINPGVAGPRQGPSSDGGWRWFHSQLASTITIYNVQLHRRAHAVLTHRDIEDSRMGPELLLACAQAHVMIDSKFFRARDEVVAQIRADFQQLREEMTNGASSSVHPARKPNLQEPTWFD